MLLPYSVVELYFVFNIFNKTQKCLGVLSMGGRGCCYRKTGGSLRRQGTNLQVGTGHAETHLPQRLS